MNDNTIRTLLDRYWKGETSIPEEQELKAYFQQPSIAEDLKVFRPLFQGIQAEQSPSLGKTFEQKVLQEIEAQSSPKVRRLYPRLLSLAATIALLIGCFYFLQKPTTIKSAGATQIVYDDNPADAEQAYIALKSALALVSKKMNKGTSKAVSSIQEVQKVTNFIKE